MMIVFKFLLFLSYLTIIFFVKNYVLLISLIIIAFILMKFFKCDIKDFFKTVLFIFPFLILTFVCNSLLGSFDESILIVIRLVLAYMITYIFSTLILVSEIVRFIEIITSPLAIFKINNKKIGLIVGISISMIPILKDEIMQRIYALNSKGYKLKLKNLNIILKPLFISIFRRTCEIEKSLISKGYQE